MIHVWDIIIAIVGIGFSYSLIPTVIVVIKNKVVMFSIQTLIITSLGMIVTLGFYATHDMWLSFSTSLPTTLCWFTLCALKYYYERK